MTEPETHRYDFENLPISEETRKGLTTENINYIGAVGRMMLLQDLFIEDTIAAQSKTMFTAIDRQNKIIQSIQKLLIAIQGELQDHETRIKKLEIKVERLLVEHKHNHPII